MAHHRLLHPGQPHASPGYTPQRPPPWPPGLPACPLRTAFRGVFPKGKCDHSTLTQDPSMALHHPQDKALLIGPSSPRHPPAVPLRPGLISMPHLILSSPPPYLSAHSTDNLTEAGRGSNLCQFPTLAESPSSSSELKIHLIHDSWLSLKRRPWLRTTALDGWFNFFFNLKKHI